jgi:nucleoside-diphosphate kinase
MIERTLVILKPDAVQRGLMGRILARFEEKGLKVVALRFTRLSRETVEKHYEPHRGKPFYAGLVEFMSAAPVLLVALEGPSAIQLCRNLMGATFGTDAAPGTIRGDFGASKGLNLVHGSDSAESANRELALFFDAGDLIEYPRPLDTWVVTDEDRR